MSENQYIVFKNKEVSVQQKDNFWKHGVLYGETEDHIILKFDDGKLHFVSKDFIKVIKEGRK